jgi:hypothetical protein
VEYYATMGTKRASRFPEPPTFEFIKERLTPFLTIVQEAVADGALHVQEYMKWQAEPVDPVLAPNLVRHKVKQFLISRGQDAVEDDDVPFETDRIPNNGICVRLEGFIVRVLKSSEDGSVPPPGASIPRNNFYNQDQALLDFAEFRNGNDTVQPTWGLVIHWRVNQKYNLLKVSLALPMKPRRSEIGKPAMECAFDEPFWTRSSSAPIQIDRAHPVVDLDVPEIRLEDEAAIGKTAQIEGANDIRRADQASSRDVRVDTDGTRTKVRHQPTTDR